jgi:diguanylate cyclase (GGDEF)-like protein
MSENILLDIIHQCMLIDKLSVEFYNRLTAAGGSASLKRFWGKYAAQEETHEDYWTQLACYAEKRELPQVFADPDSVYEDLQRRAENIKGLTAEAQAEMTPAQAFSLAYRLETYKLHPAFRTLFRNYYLIAGNPVPDRIQESTILRLSEALKKYGVTSPEMNLVAEILQLLWEQNKQLAERATQDELTSLLNRRGFMVVGVQMAALARRKQIPLTLLMADINDFRRINEKFGSVKGDELIRVVASLLKRTLRNSDLIARFNADDFTALLPETSLEGGQKVAEKLQKALEKASPVGVELNITTIIVQGNVIGDPEIELQELVRQAEYKLFIEKQSASF